MVPHGYLGAKSQKLQFDHNKPTTIVNRTEILTYAAVEELQCESLIMVNAVEMPWTSIQCFIVPCDAKSGKWYGYIGYEYN